MSRTWNKIRRELTADKKKLGLFVTLIAVGLLLWGRLILLNVPRTVVADPKDNTKTASKSTKDPTPGSSVVSSSRRVVELTLYETIDRDLFSLRGDLFSRIDPKPENNSSEPKLVGDLPDEQLRRQQAVLADARKLKLQSTLLGLSPRALIDGQLLKVGETIQGFELMEVRSRNVTLRKDGVDVVLDM